MMLSDILELTTKAKKKTLQNLLNQSSIHRERTNTTRDRHRQKNLTSKCPNAKFL